MEDIFVFTWGNPFWLLEPTTEGSLHLPKSCLGRQLSGAGGHRDGGMKDKGRAKNRQVAFGGLPEVSDALHMSNNDTLTTESAYGL